MNTVSLLASEWLKMEDMTRLLEPFAKVTDIVQTDALSLSYIIPSLVDLQVHLEQFTNAKSFAKDILRDFKQRFDSILNPLSDTFNPLPAAACLLDPTEAILLLSTEMTQLLEAATSFIISTTQVYF